MQKTFLFIAAIMGAIAVLIGAFGAHGLSASLDLHQASIYEKGVTYQFYHVFALIACSILYAQKPSKIIKVAYWLFFSGIICFSGSLYVLATAHLTGIPQAIVGPITPIGGLLFVAAWILLCIFSLMRPFGQRSPMGI